MKILHIIDSLSMGGAENMLVGLTSGQQRQGHEVLVMPLVCASDTLVRRKMEEAGIEVRPFKGSGSVYNPLFIIKIAKTIRRYDIVHVHLFPALYWVAFAKMLSLSKVPIIYTEHSTDNKRRNNPFLHWVDRFVYQHGYKRIVACAEKVMETYKLAFPSINNVCYINNGVDISLFANASPYTKTELLGVSESTFIITMVARFMSMKRQDTIVEALTKLPDDIHAVFVGGNKDDEGLIKVKELANGLGVQNRVHFLYIRSDVPRILKTLDVIIMASDYEGLSLSSIEGMAAGKPFVASDVNGLREVVGGAGLLFENRNSASLAELINKLHSDSVFYKDIQQRCEERAKEYDAQKMADEYLKVYQSCLDKN